MRKSQALTRGLWAAGAATALTAAAVVVAAPPVYATVASATTSTPGGGPASGQVTLTLASALSGVTTPVTYFSTAACADTYSSTTAAANITATTTKVDDNSAKVTVPSTLSLNSGAPRTYYICIYASSTAGAAGKIQGTYTLTPIGSITPANGPSGGGNTITYSAPAGSTPFASATAPYAQFVTSGCSSTYGTPTTLYAAAPKLSSSSVSISVPSSVVGNPPTAGTSAPAATPYQICVYNGNSSGDVLLASTAASGYSVTLNTISLSQNTGAGYTNPNNPVNLTISSPTGFLTGITAPGVVFNTSPCLPNNAGTPLSRNISSKTATTLTGDVAMTSADVGKYVNSITGGGTNTNGSALITAVDNSTHVATVAGGNFAGTITAVTIGNALNSDTAARKLANNKAAVTLPSAITATANYNVCVYADTTTGKLLGATGYTAVVVPQVTGITPAAGSPLGGGTVTISGTNFPTTPGSISATLGGADLTNITPVDGSTFTATAPAHGNGTVSLSVSTPAGITTLQNAYSYANSISVSPNTAPNSNAAVDVDVQGSGFGALTFSASPTALVGPRVYLVAGQYNGNGATGARNNVNAMASCANVLVITDNELICTLDLTQTLKADDTLKTWSNTSSTSIVTANTSYIATAGTNVFTQGDVGKAITDTNGSPAIPPNTTIVAVLDGKTALMSNAATANANTHTVIVGTTTRTISAATTTTLTGTFTQADVGAKISAATGLAIATGTPIISSVNAAGTIATVTGGTFTPASGTADVTPPASVPPGAYNLVVVSDASLNAAANAGYSQSTASSGSTFTVANY